MSDDAKIYTILCTAMVIACSVAWYCRNDEALIWRDKYQELEQTAKVQKDHADVRFNTCMNQFLNINRGRNK
jgi:hypothetical protein